jgi:site-specific DNA recombinase
VPTCDLYLRFSDLRIEEPFDKREAKLRALADALGWIVFRVVVENDMTPSSDGKLRPASAFKRKKIMTPSGRYELRVVRPGFREVLDDITTGRVNGLLAEDLDRTLRDPRDCEDLLDACQMTGASARSLSGSLTLTNGGTEAERSMARVMVAIANKHRLTLHGVSRKGASGIGTNHIRAAVGRSDMSRPRAPSICTGSS